VGEKNGSVQLRELSETLTTLGGGRSKVEPHQKGKKFLEKLNRL